MKNYKSLDFKGIFQKNIDVFLISTNHVWVGSIKQPHLVPNWKLRLGFLGNKLDIRFLHWSLALPQLVIGSNLQKSKKTSPVYWTVMAFYVANQSTQFLILPIVQPAAWAVWQLIWLWVGEENKSHHGADQTQCYNQKSAQLAYFHWYLCWCCLPPCPELQCKACSWGRWVWDVLVWIR